MPVRLSVVMMPIHSFADYTSPRNIPASEPLVGRILWTCGEPDRFYHERQGKFAPNINRKAGKPESRKPKNAPVGKRFRKKSEKNENRRLSPRTSPIWKKKQKNEYR